MSLMWLCLNQSRVASRFVVRLNPIHFGGGLCAPGVRLRSSGRSTVKNKISKSWHNNENNEDIENMFTKILSESWQRMEKILTPVTRKIQLPNLRSKPIQAELGAPIQEGNLIWTGNTVHLVLRMPQTFKDHILTMNMRGIVVETPWTQVRARLHSGVPPEVLDIPLNQLTMEEITTDELEDASVTLPKVASSSYDYPRQDKSYAQAHVVGRPVNSWLFTLAANHLRQYHNEIERVAQKWKPDVLATVLNKLQQPEKVVIVPMIDFVASTTSRTTDPPLVSVLDYCAIQLCLEHDLLQFVVQPSVFYVSTDTLIILPSSMSREMLEAQNTPEVSHSYLQNYANGNIINSVSESRAIEELRKRYPEASYIDRQEAAELLKLEDGGMWDRLGYQWIYQIAASNRLTPKTLSTDKLASLREDFSHTVYCIDAPGSKLAEDGISIEKCADSKSEGEKYRVGIHIADPAAFMDLGARFTEGLPLLGTVLERSSVWRMLPPDFTKQLSLDAPGRPTLSVFADVDLRTGSAENVELKPLRLLDVRNLQTRDLHISRNPFDDFWKVTESRLRYRYEQGAFLLNPYTDGLDGATQTNNGSDFTGNPSMLPLLKSGMGTSNIVVEEFMLLANELVAEYCKKHDIPVFYRSRRLLLPSRAIKEEFEADRLANRGFVGAHWRKVISSPQLTVTPSQFPGLGTKLNTRFTSPLRRMEDLLVHTQIGAHLLRIKGSSSVNTELVFSAGELESLRDQFEVMEHFIQALTRDVAFLKTFKRAVITPGMRITGVVVKNLSETPNSSIYMPELQLYADYKGNTELPIEHKQAFTITRVLSYARSIHVE